MTDREMIIEIAKVLNECCGFYDEKGVFLRNKCNNHDCEYWCDTNNLCCSYNKKEATALYKAGYRKIPEGAVVLTKDEFWKLSNKFSKKELDEIVEFHKNKTRKETAEKIYNRAVSHPSFFEFLDWIKTKFGLEIKE